VIGGLEKNRDPEEGGYDLWSGLLDRTSDFSRVTSEFITSLEYRQRFVH
jgi:hypothetical protein